ncbi:MAG: MATE family efflux transporter [Clostridia bacterium]|nr:MATE family efflux transporter [Clostridia bacterium]
MRIQLSDHFSYSRLLRFTLPSIIMMVFTSIYGVVDGIFVSNYTGTTSFAAVNIIWPFLQGLSAVGFMIGTGGSALVAKLLGEGDNKKANETFSMLVYASCILSLALSALSFIFMDKIAMLLGAEGNMIGDCVLYGRILVCALPFFMFQAVFQSFLITAEKPKLGLVITVVAGVTNIIGDALFVGVFKWGLSGAALATALSQFIGGAIPLYYFVSSKNDSLLHLGKARFDARSFLKASSNGVSEMTTNLSMSIVSILYNLKLMAIAGENGVAAYGVIMYLNFVFVSIFLGYSLGFAPIVSFNFGAQNHDELKSIFKKSTVIFIVSGFSMLLIGILASSPLSASFVGYDRVLFEMTKRGMIIYCISFIFSGINIFASSFFTALNNGLISAVISLSRTFFFQIIAISVLPVFWGLDGIWFSVVVAEGISLLISVFFLVKMRKRYNY